MSLVTDSLPALFNGVSQQAALVRSKDQLEDQVNGWSSLADGLGKRPPSEHIAKLYTTPPANAHVHEINRDATEQYVVIAAAGAIRVFDLAGNEKTVTAPGGWGYLSGITDWDADISMFTVKDYTFVVNKKKVVTLDTFTTYGSADSSYYAWLNRGYATDALGVPYGPGLAYQYPIPSVGSGISGEVQTFSKLPDDAINGTVYRVSGGEETRFVSYYVRKNGGVWDETLVPGGDQLPKAVTMPHALIRQGDGTFKFVPFSWAPRRVGDETTNPVPGFVGRTISKVFFCQNRLMLLYDENITGSCVGDFGNFWRNTVLDYIDSDVVDAAPTTTKVAMLYDAAPFNGGIVLTSDQTQFSLNIAENGLAASSMSIDPVTNYSVNIRAGLSVMGSEVYYATESNGWASIKEYTHLADSDATAAANITGHVPRYIPAGVRRIVPAEDVDALFVLTDGDPESIFVYQFYWVNDSQKAQSAWHRWEMGDKVLAAGYLKGYLYVLVERDDGFMLERIDLQPGSKPSAADHQVHLDRRCAVTGSYNSSANRTDFALPYQPIHTLARAVLGSGFSGRQLQLLDPANYSWPTSSTLRVPGNWAGSTVYVGHSYTFRFQVSQQYVRKQDGTAVTTGRLQLRTFTLTYRDTGYFQTEVAPYGPGYDTALNPVIPSKVGEFTGRVVGSGDLILNRPSFHTGKYTFTVSGNAELATIAVSNDSHVSSTFLSGEWEGFYWNRAQA